MAKQFSYTVQVEGRALKEQIVTGREIHENWNVFHKNPDEKGLWIIDENGYLRITTNQAGLSGRYDPKMLNATNYTFFVEAIPSGEDDDAFGIVFRYQDNFHFYFVAWNGGGEYNWEPDTLRLYKVNGDEYKLLASSDGLGHWVGGQRYTIEVQAHGNLFVVKVDGQERIRVVDNDNPYLYGAYGPCASSQVTTFVSFSQKVEQSFTLSTTFTNDVTIDNWNYATGKALAPSVVSLVEEAVQNYLVQNGYEVESLVYDRFVISTPEPAVEVYFRPSAPSTTTQNPLDVPYAYLKDSEEPPTAPSNFRGVPGLYSIIWMWDDTVRFEDGFEILDENGNVLAVVGKDATSWEETGLNPNTLYTRKLRAYNRYGVSPELTASARTENLAIIRTPNAPQNLRAMVKGTTTISWYWDPVPDADGYRLYSDKGELIADVKGTSYTETGLQPDTLYKRYVKAYNAAGESSPSNLAMALTEAEPVSGDAPEAPLNLQGEALGETVIRWFWEPSPSEDVIQYRLYDENNTLIYEGPADVFEFLEQNLNPGTSYIRYVKAVNAFGESARSNMAMVTTPKEEETFIPDEGDETVDLSGITCKPVEGEPEEKLDAFQSGVGDGLDLRVDIDKEGTPREQFTYDLQLKGYEYIPIEVYPRQDFRFRFRAEGTERFRVQTGRFEGKLRIYPAKSYRYAVKGRVETEAGFSYRAVADAVIRKEVQNPIPFSYTPYAQVNYIKTTNIRTADIFSGPSAVVWGPNRWTYDATTDTVRGLDNTSWSGFYSRDFLNLEDYEFECEFGVINQPWQDDDMIGITFRLQENADGTRRFYYFVADRWDSAGTGVGKWKLYCSRNGRDYRQNLIAEANTPSTGWRENVRYKIRVQVAGPRIRIWMDGQLVIDVVHDDPTMRKGSFGPTCNSQEAVEFRNFKLTYVYPQVVYGPTQSDAITDVHNSQARAKQLTSQTAAQILQPYIQNAYNQYKSQPGNENATLEIVGYGVQDTRNEVVTFTAQDGNQPLYAYTTATTKAIQEFPVTIVSDAFSDRITEQYGSAQSAKLLSQALAETKPHTVQELLAQAIAEYKAQHQLTDSEFIVRTYRAESLTPETTVYTDKTDGTGYIYAYTAAGTVYTGEKEYTGTVYAYQGWITGEPTSRIVLTNKHGEVYTGPLNAVTFTLENRAPGTEIAWQETKTADAQMGLLTPMVRTSDMLEASIQEDVDGKNPYMRFVRDLIAIPEASEYQNAHVSVQKTGGHDNTFAYFRSQENLVSFGDEVIAPSTQEVLVLSATEREVEKPWSGYSEWYYGTVNGNEPFVKDGDGKKDLRVPVDVEVTDNITVQKWSVETDNPDIRFYFENGTETETTKPGDSVVFYSDKKETYQRKVAWYGPKITGETVYEVKEGETLTIQDRILSPLYDPLLSTKNISDWRLIVLSKNPNVAIRQVNALTFSPDERFVNIILEARLINPTQAAWHPLIHSGFYYLNQKEHYLFAESRVRGALQEKEEFQQLEFPFTVKVLCERYIPEGIRSWTDKNRSDFRGLFSNVEYSIEKGGLILVGAQSGTYVSEIKQVSDDPVEEWKAIHWVSNEPFGSQVKVEASVYVNDAWTPWTPVENGNAPSLPPSNQIRYRVTLEAGQEKRIEDHIVLDEKALLSYGTHENTAYQNESVVMADTEEAQGIYLSRVFDLGDAVEELGTLTYQAQEPFGSRIDVYTITADSPEGPWDGTGEPFVPLQDLTLLPDGRIQGRIASVKKRYLRYQVRFSRGREDATLTLRFAKNEAFAQGKVTNLVFAANGLQLADVEKEGTWVSPILDFGNVTAFDTLTLDVAMPEADGSIEVYTASASNAAALAEGQETWVPLQNGVIASAPGRYLKVKVVLRAGRAALQDKTVVHDAQGDFAKDAVFSNITATADGKLVLTNAQTDGYYESAPLDFRYAESWKTLSHLTKANGGNVQVYTQSGDSPLGPWEDWTPVGPNGEIQSSAKSFLRYKLVLSPGVTEEAAVWQDNTQERFQTGAALTNGQYLHPTAIQSVDPTEPLIFESGIKVLPDVKAYDKLVCGKRLGEGAVLRVYTQSSPDGEVWSAWEEAGPNGEIRSPAHPYLRYRLEVTPGYGLRQQGFLARSGSGFLTPAPHLENAEVAESPEAPEMVSIHLVSLLDENKTVQTGEYISDILDFGGFVEAWGNLSLSLALPDTGGSVRVYTVSSNDPSLLLTTTLDEAKNLPWQEATFNEETQSYVVVSPPGRYVRIRFVLEAGFGPQALATFSETNWNGTHLNTQADANGLALAESTQEGTYTSAVIDAYTPHDRFDGWNSYSLDVEGAPRGGAVELYVKAAATPEDLALATEVLVASVQDGQSTGSLVLSGPYMQYRLVLKPGRGEPTPVSVGESAFTLDGDDANVTLDVDGALTISDLSASEEENPAVGTYLTGVFPVSDFDSWDKVTWDGDATYGQVRLFTNVQGADGTWEGWMPVESDGRITSRSTDVQAVQIKIELVAGKDENDAWVSPTVSSVSLGYNAAPYITPRVKQLDFAAKVRSAKSPEVFGMSWSTAIDGFAQFVPNELFDVSILYTKRIYKSPEVDRVTIGAKVYEKASPVVKAITANAQVYFWHTPMFTGAKLEAKTYRWITHTPVLQSLTIEAQLPDQRLVEEHGVSLRAKIPADTQKHKVTDQTMKTLIDRYMVEQGIDETNLVRKQYFLIPGIPGVFLEVKENNASEYYLTGESEVYAYTTDAVTEVVYSQAKVTVNENNEAVVTPVPRQGSPIVVRDATGTELTQVAFVDESGRPTLTNTETLRVGDEPILALTYANIDLDTLEVWVDEEHSNNYTKIDGYVLCNNILYLPKRYAKGTPVRVSYRIKRSFVVDANYEPDADYALIRLHGAVLDESREITVRYETSEQAAYYRATEVDLNPMRNLLSEGFLYLADSVEPAVRLEVFVTPKKLCANGYDRTTIFVVAKDQYGNPVAGDHLVFDATDGILMVNQPVTDANGLAIATYVASRVPGTVTITVYDRTSRVEGKAVLELYEPIAQPRISLFADKVTLIPDGRDGVVITAKVVNDKQEPAVDTEVVFETAEGILEPAVDRTNYAGKASAVLRTDSVPQDGIITVKATVPSLGIAEAINIAVREVSPVV